ncbi:hypothetical protein TgHK011_008581 [Trichoderma gracile]|nr:hypothetical protein TgHK011_008581 [Trichoderma gracile]
MIGRFAQRRRGRTEIVQANFQVYPKRPSSSTVTGALNQLSMLITTKRYWGFTTFTSGCLTFQFPPCHSFCTRTKTEIKTPSAKSNLQPTRLRLSYSAEERDKALMNEANAYANSLKAAKGEDGFLKTKLRITRELGFCGTICVDLKDGAVDMAECLLEGSDHHHLVLFVDGSIRPKGRRESGLSATAGTAVGYKPLGGNQIWVERYFSPAKCKGKALRAEIIAILNGLKVAAVEVELFRGRETRNPDSPAANIRVTILSDCTRALHLLERLQNIAADPELLNSRIMSELVAVSQYLHRKGVEVNLRWVRGHSTSKGNALAHSAARYAARHPEIGAILEKQLRVQFEPLSKATKARSGKEKKKSTRCEAATPIILPEVQNHIIHSERTSEL